MFVLAIQDTRTRDMFLAIESIKSKLITQEEVHVNYDRGSARSLAGCISAWCKGQIFTAVVIPCDPRLIQDLNDSRVVVHLIAPTRFADPDLVALSQTPFVETHYIGMVTELVALIKTAPRYQTLLERTTWFLNDHQLQGSDIEYFTTPDGGHRCTWEEYCKLADFNSPSGITNHDAVGLIGVLRNGRGFIQLTYNECRPYWQLCRYANIKTAEPIQHLRRVFHHP